ncbi:MAG: protoporphyrinogen oxidase [bacterium]|nr:protoporphyrinogen oxidase [bacterium]
MKVAVIGAGISGLSIAYFLKKKGYEVEVYEKNSKAGGRIVSNKENGFLYETGPQTFLMNEFLSKFINEIGLDEELIFASPQTKNRYILKNNELIPLPLNPKDFLKSKLISFKGKVRVLAEIFKKNIPETVSDFFTYRFGREVLDYIVEPFISGIFAGDPDKLVVKYAFPEVYSLAKKYGSLLKAAKNFKPSGKLFSFKNGSATLINRLVSLVGNIKFNSEIKSIKEVEASKYVFSIPAYDLNNILNLDINIEYADVVVIALGFKREDVSHTLDGFGFLIPRVEKKFLLGCLFSSSIFPYRAPEGSVLLTAYAGGSRNKGVIELSSEVILSLTLDELGKILGIKSEPVFVRVVKIKNAIPQYEIGYEKVVKIVSDLMHKNIYICSNFYGGISTPNCILNAYRLTDKI